MLVVKSLQLHKRMPTFLEKSIPTLRPDLTVRQISCTGKFELHDSGYDWTQLETWKLGLDLVPYTTETFCSLSIKKKSHPVQHKTVSQGEDESSSA